MSINLLEKIETLPLLSGCYIFKNKHDEIIYIGKSKALKNRLKQHFSGTDKKEGKYIRLYKEVVDFEYIITESETDALILECELIKKHKPKYNSQLKGEKVFPFIKINVNCDYPTLSIVDTVQNDGSKYFGCFYNYDDAFRVIELINSIWHTPICTSEIFRGKTTCLNYHIKKCCAPCARLIPKKEYLEKIKEIEKLFEGKYSSIKRELKSEMLKYSKDLNFEKAAYLRDLINNLDKLCKRIKRLNTNLENKEVFLFFRAFNENGFTLFYIKNGVVLADERFQSNNVDQFSNFVQKIENQDFNSYPEALAHNLLEIYADKLFITLPKDRSNILKKVTKELKEYLF